jgi:two-component system LytT family response regulator
MNYSVVLVEDELHQQQTVMEMLSSFPEFKLMGVASNVEEGEKLLQSIKPDLALLDVMLSSQTSFDMLSKMKQIPFEIIFTTSYDHFAVQAFRLSAIDYLMKPIARNDFAQALEKFKQQQVNHNKGLNIQNLLSNLQLSETDSKTKIALPTTNGFLFICIKDIIRCESDNNYTTFHTRDKNKIIISKTMKEIELMLLGYHFFRVHNSHLINLECINEYIKGEGGFVRMSDGSLIEVSRRRKDEFLQQLHRL